MSNIVESLYRIGNIDESLLLKEGQYEYNGYVIQDSAGRWIVRDSYGKILGCFSDEKDAEHYIDTLI